MLSKEEIEKMKNGLQDFVTYYDDHAKDENDNIIDEECYRIANIIDNAFYYIEQLETENINLNQILELGLNKEKQYCFKEDGNTGLCLGYGNDEPCNYCKSCKRLSIKEND